jgi:uncharacterized membrane protein
MASPRALWTTGLVAAVAGIVLTGLQIVERIAILKDPAVELSCDVSDVISCSNVLSAWQSSVILGIPNAFIGAVMFSLFLATCLAGAMGSTLSRPYLRTVLGLALFFAAFATWFMLETGFAIGALCVWCTGIITAVAVIGACLTRILARTAPDSAPFATARRSGLDVVLWAAWWALLLALVAVGLFL